MTNEEKKAVKSFKQENENDLSRFEDFNDYTQTLIKRNNTISNLIKKQQAEIEKYKYLYQKALDNTIKSDRENIRKDKIIDEMAEQLKTPINSKKDVIEYFENLAKESGEIDEC